MNIKNKAYALDTEGSSGLGLAFVHQMVDKGYTICIVSKEKLPVLENKIETKTKVKCISIYIDLSQDDESQKVHLTT